MFLCVSQRSPTRDSAVGSVEMRDLKWRVQQLQQQNEILQATVNSNRETNKNKDSDVAV